MILLLLSECSLSSVENQMWGHSKPTYYFQRDTNILHSGSRDALTSNEPPGGISTTLFFPLEVLQKCQCFFLLSS